MLPPAVQDFVINSTAWIASIDEMIAKDAELASSIKITQGEMRAMGGQAAAGATIGADAGAAAAAAETAAADDRVAMAAREAAAAETQLTNAERMAAEGAKLEAEMQADLAREQALTAESSKVLGEAQGAQARAMATNREATTALRTPLQNAAAGMRTLGGGVIIAAAGMAGYGVKAASDYQAEIVKLKTSAGESGEIIGGKLTGNLKMVSDALLKMSVETATSTHELTSGMYMVESAGYQGAQGLQVMKVAAQGARAEQAPLRDVTNSLTTVMRDFNVQPENAARVMNTMTAAVGRGKMTMGDFAAAIGEVSPMAQQAKISFGELSGAMATLTQHGATARGAANDLTAVIKGMQAPNLQAIKEMDRMGVSATDVSTHLGQRGLVGTLQLYTAAIAKHTTNGQILIDTLNHSKTASDNANAAFAALPPNVQKMATAYQQGTITQKEWATSLKSLPPITANLASQWATAEKRATGFSDLLKSGSPLAQSYAQALSKMTGGQNALRAALQLTGGNLSETQANIAATSAAWDSGTKKVSGFAESQQTMKYRLDQAKESMHAMAITVGNTLIPIIQKLFGFFAQHPLITKFATIGVAAFLALAVAMKVFSTISGMVTSIKLAVTAIKDFELMSKIAAAATKIWAAAQWLLNAAMDSNIIGIIVIAVIALVAAIIYCWFHFKGFRDFVKAAWHDIAAVALWLWHDVFEPAWKGISVGAVWLYDNIIKPYFKLMVLEFKIVSAIVLWWWHNIMEPAFKLVAGYAVWWYTNAKLAFDKFMNSVHSVIDIMMMWWHGVMEPAYKAVGAVILWWWHNVVEPAYKAVGKVISEWWDHVVKPAFGLFMDGIHLVAKLITWWWHTIVEPAFSAVKITISGFATGAKTTFNNFVNDVKNILNWFTGVGRMFGGWFKSAYDAVRGAVGDIIKFVGSIPRNIINALGNVSSMLFNAGKQIIQGLIDGIQSMFSGLSNVVGNIAGFIASHKGPIDKDRVLLHPQGKAIIQGLIKGISLCLPELYHLMSTVAPRLQSMISAPSFTNVMSKITKTVTDAVPSLQFASSGAGFATASNVHTVTSTIMTAVPTTPPAGASSGHTVIVNVAGSVKTERDLQNVIQEAVLRMNVRNPTNQYSLPAGR